MRWIVSAPRAVAAAMVFSMLLAPPALWSQGVTTGAITGKVTDAGGQPVALADVRIVNRSNGFTTSTRTRENGLFLVQGLEVGGPYTVIVNKSTVPIGSGDWVGVLVRDDPPAAWFLVDEAVLHRCVGSPDVMAAQLAHLAGLAGLPNVTIQVVPSIAHAGLLGGFAAAERAAYVETAVAGQVFEDADIIAGLLTRFDTLRNEALRGSESLALIERMCTEWTATGARAVTQAPTAENA